MKAKIAKRCKNRENGFQSQILEEHILEAVKDVVAAILIRDEKVLIAQRAKDDPLAGLWEFPGGKVEDGESPEDSLIREMQEEFCIDIEVGKFFACSLFPYDKGTIRLLAYLCTWIRGEIISTVHNDYLWVAIDELDQYTFAPADRPLVEKLKRQHR
jgi:8-oxo-dGTP diphosphatase